MINSNRYKTLRVSRQLTRAVLAAVLGFAMMTIIAVTSAYAQGGRKSDYLLYPQVFYPRFIGVEAGYVHWFSSGSFAIGESTVPCVAFESGDGGGFTGGIKSLLYLNDWLILSPRISYESRSTTFKTPLPSEPARDASNNVVTLEQQAESHVALSSATFDFRVGVDIAHTGLYVAAGAAVGKLFEGTYDYSEQITSPSGLGYSDTHTNEHQLVTEKTFTGLASIVVDLRGSLGYIVNIGRRFAINPEVTYDFPLTYSVNAPENLKQSGIMATIGFMINLNVEK